MPTVNVIIPGAPKAGTTSIASILNQHADIYVPALKEPRFFIEDKIKELDDNTPLKKYLMRTSILDGSKYNELYVDNRSKFKIDASVQYLYYYKTAGPKIKKYLGDPYVFIILRDPIQRAISNYFFNRGAEMKLTKNFIEAIKQETEGKRDKLFGFQHNYKQGLYYEQVKYYLENFSKVKVLFYEDFQSDNLKFINSMLDFLEVPPFKTIKEVPKLRSSSEITFLGKLLIGKYSPYRLAEKIIFPLFFDQATVHLNKVKIKARFLKNKPHRNELSEEEAKFMYDLYRQDVIKLMQLLNLKSCPWPRFNI